MNEARLTLARFTRLRRGWVTMGLWVALALVVAAMGRARAVAHGADHALLGVYGAIALPLLAYGVVAQGLGSEGLARSGVSLLPLGASPLEAARASVAVVVLVSALLSGLLGAAVAVIAHGSADPPIVADAARSFEIGLLGGAAYGAFFMFGASFGARGFGRSLLLVLDWTFGVGGGASSLLVPRAHVHNLLGGGSPLDVSSRGSFLALVIITVASAGLAVMRAARVEWKLPR